MERWWFNSMFFKKEFELKCDLNKSMGSLGPIENTSEDPNLKVKNIHSCISDRNGDTYSIYFDIENQIFEVDNDHSFLSELEIIETRVINDEFRGEDPYNNSYMSYTYDTQDSWINHINSYIDNYLQSQICIDTSIISGSGSYSDSYIYRAICSGQSLNSSENEGSSRRTRTKDSHLTIRESSNDLEVTQKYKHLWVQCENCYGLNYKKFLK
uniref:Acetyl-CoA carboxylase beta subunit n=1 Tax=Solanum lycopersicum TaxID=4081 RepID=A0A3Q7GUR2_SOLLC